MMDEQIYTRVCVLRRCGQLEGDKACCDAIKRSGLHKIVLDSMWQEISGERCAQFCAGHCLTRLKCETEQSFCYPVPVHGKRPNKLVAVMFAWYCVHVAENAARAATSAAARAAARAATRAAARAAAREADMVADAADYITRAANAAARAASYMARSADVVQTAADAAREAGEAAQAAANVADAADATGHAVAVSLHVAGASRRMIQAAREQFYIEASREIERLVNAWGTPVKEEEERQ